MVLSIKSVFTFLVRFLITLTLTAALTSCGGKKNEPRNAPAIAPAPVPEPEPAPTPEPEPAPTPEPPVDDQKAEIEDDVGIEVPDISTTEVSEIETGDKPQKVRLVFNADPAKRDKEGRFLEEYLIIITASEESCIRLKARPSAGLSSEISDENIGNQNGDSPCEAVVAEAIPGEKPEEEKPEEEKPDGENQEQPSPDTNADNNTASASLGLASASAELCSLRLFRMPSGQSDQFGEPFSLGPIVTKTANLVHISSGKKVRIWVDQELTRFCSFDDASNSLQPLTSANGYPFGPLIQYGTAESNEADQLYLAHIQNLAEEVEKNLNTLTGLYGSVSDLDESGTIDVFISPDVNRQYFVKQETRTIDKFEANMVHKPQDMARYNSLSNPTSNEGEILYLWAPDPGGIYKYSIFPSSNSLTSNYAKGYLSAQIMHLISYNRRLIDGNGTPEKKFLLDALSFLAADYTAGNSYSYHYKTTYLVSRPQELSLTEAFDPSIVPDEINGIVNLQHKGLRAMFGWYLHRRLCGDGIGNSVAPCPEIKRLIDTDFVGVENLEKVLEQPFDQILKHFGAVLGISLLDNPQKAIDLNQATIDANPEAKLLPIYTLPRVGEIRTDDPPVTVEINKTGDALIEGSNQDRTYAGPFPNMDSLLFQPILPDSDLDIKLQKDSVTYILLTGLIEPETFFSASIGAKTSVKFFSIDARDQTKREIFLEKVSEEANIDLRPINLTKTVDDTRTKTYYAPIDSQSLDFTVDEKKELWLLGSLDNYKIRTTSESSTIGDSDAYSILIHPCKGLEGEEFNTCRAKPTQSVLVQLLPRDSNKEVLPMGLVTTPSLSIFRGPAIWAYGDDMTKELEPEFDTPALCQSQTVFTNDLADATTCANGGFTLSDYQNKVCTDNAEDASCMDGDISSASMFTNYHTIYDKGYYAMFDNFLQSHEIGFPFLNNSTFVSAAKKEEYENDNTNYGYRYFRPEEINRQFLHFDYESDFSSATTYKFHPAITFGLTFSDYSTDLPFDDIDKTLTEEELSDLDSLYAYANLPDGENLTAALTTAKSNTIYVTETGHSRQTGDAVAISNTPGFGGIDPTILNGTHSIVKEDADTWKIVLEGEGLDDNTIDTGTIVLAQPALLTTDSRFSACVSLLGQEDTICELPAGVSPKTESKVDEGIIVCIGDITDPSNCDGYSLSQPGTRTTNAWMDPSQYVLIGSSTDSYTTHYVPVKLGVDNSYNSICAGTPDIPAEFSNDMIGLVTDQFCVDGSRYEISGKDIRQQLNVATKELTFNCSEKSLGDDFKVCADRLSYRWLTSPGDNYNVFVDIEDRFSNMRVRERELPIDNVVGEAVGIVTRLNYIYFDIPTPTDAEKAVPINLVIGGGRQSQGKYLVRVRTTSFDHAD